MPRVIAFLRAINVDRGRVVKMARICEELGCYSPGPFGAISDGRPYGDSIQMIVDGKSIEETNESHAPSDKEGGQEDALGKKMREALAFLVALLLCAAGAQASGSPIPHGTLELIADNQWIAIGHPFYLGLHFQLERGWHIYWVNPGDSGEPPRVTWQLPPGLSAGVIEWPAPRRLGTSSIVDFGYENAVTLIAPVRAEISLAAQPLARVGAEVKVLVCREMCIPGRTQLSLTLPIKSRPPAPDVRTRELFAAARKDLPRPAPNWKFSADDAKDSFVLAANVAPQITQAIFFPLAEAQIDNSAPQILQPLASGFRLTLRKSDRLLKPIERLKGVLVLSGNHAYLIDVPVSKRGAQKNNPSSGIHEIQSSREGPQK